MFRTLRNLPLRTKLVLSVSGVLAALAAFILVFIPTRMEQLSREWSERRAAGYASLLATSAVSSLEFQDEQSATTLLQTIASASDAVYAVLRLENGTPLASWKPENVVELAVTPKNEPIVVYQGGRLHVVAAVRTPSGDTGLLALGFSLSELEDQTRANVRVVAMAIGVAFLVALAIIFGLGTVLVRPIRRMMEVSLSIARGDLVTAEQALGGTALEQRKDEVGRLAGAFAEMLVFMRGATTKLHSSAEVLTHHVTELSSASSRQNHVINRQALALQQTQSTARDIQQTSRIAAERAREVLVVAQQADEAGRSGAEAIEQTLQVFNQIRARVENISERILKLDESMRQIGGITDTVKDLADQTNILALNAGIEAARSGDHGRGFTVVAREMRNLATQSLEATGQVQKILAGVDQAMQGAVGMTREGVKGISEGLVQMKGSGESLREVSELLRQASGAVREIATAVEQQNAGFQQVFTSVTEFSELMDQSLDSIHTTNSVVDSISSVSGTVAEVAGRYQV